MTIEERLAALEARVERLEAERGHGWAPRLLRSWAEICWWTRLSRRQLLRYKREGCPIQRQGRHIRLEPSSYGTWMMAREPHQRARREARKAI